MLEKENNKHDIFLYILLAGVFVTIITSFYSFYYKKSYNFNIETKCDPKTETCFFRDCENDPNICPPNNLSYYNQYTIKANDFSACENEDCTLVCATGVIRCMKIECTVEDLTDGICVEPGGLSNQIKN